MKAWVVNAFWVGAGGFIGTSLRYLATEGVTRLAGRAFPVGTLTVNMLGCFAIGLLIGTIDSRPGTGQEIRLFLGIGLLGGFTTYSTFSYETFALLSDQMYGRATLNVALHLVLGLVAVWCGFLAAFQRQ